MNADSDASKFISAVKLTLGSNTFDLVTGLPLWKFVQTAKYRRFDQAIMEVHRLSKKMIDQAQDGRDYSFAADLDNLSLLQKS